MYEGKGLPEPEYREKMGSFSVYFYRDIYTEDDLKKNELNERWIKGVLYLKKHRRITHKKYQELCQVKKRQASDDLRNLKEKEILIKIGTTGKDILCFKGAL